MIPNRIEKKGISIKDGHISIFGCNGHVDNGKWIIKELFGDLIEISPAPISGEIEMLINGDIKSGNFEEISHVELDAYSAVCLFLEGRVTYEDVSKSESDQEKIIFKLISFNTILGKKRFDVVVNGYLEYEIATIGKDGSVV